MGSTSACPAALRRMTGNLPERDYARGKRVCNDGFQDVARTNGALDDDDDGCSTQRDSWRCTAKIGRPIRIMTGIAPDAPILQHLPPIEMAMVRALL